MRRERRPASFLRGLLLFLLGALVGANVVYFLMSRATRSPVSPPSGDRIETPLPLDGRKAAETDAPVPTAAAPASPVLPDPAALPRADARATGASAADESKDSLLIPVQGVTATQLTDTFSDARSEGRSHDAIDIMAAAGAPVLAAADGSVEKLFTSKQGGLTLYQFNPQRTLAYYYAHLQGYAAGIAEDKPLKRGDVIGYVGSTGNASPQAPHLHFAIFVLGPEKQWWKGEAINPYPQLRGASR